MQLHRLPLRWRALAAVSTGTWAFAALVGWAPLRFVAGSLLALLVPGLAVLRALGLLGRSTLWTICAAGALSPPVLAGALTLAGRHSPNLDWLGLGLLGGCAVVLAWPARPVRADMEPPLVPDYARTDPADRTTLVLGVLMAVVVAGGELNPWVREWSDGWFHAAVFHELGRAGIPPDFPHFAGQTLPYPWLVHVFMAGIRRVVSPDPFTLLAVLSVWSAFLLPLGAHLLARALGASAPAACWASLASILGVNAFGCLILVGRSLVGQTTGIEALRSGLADTNAIQVGLAYGFSFFQSSLLARLWTPTAFNLAVALAGLGMALLLESWDRPRPRNLALLCLAFALLLMWHTLTAYAVTIATVTSVGAAVWGRWRGDRIESLLRAGLIAAAVALAHLLARPFLSQITLGSAGGQLAQLRLSAANVWGLALSMGLVVFAGGWGWTYLGHERRPLVAGLLAGLVLPYLLFDLPGPAEEKLYFPLFMVLCALAAPVAQRAWARRGGRLILTAWLVCGLASGAMTFWAFSQDHRPRRILFTGDARPGVTEFTPDEEIALRWVRERSPRQAVFLQRPRPFSNEPLLAYGARRLFLGPAEFFYRAIFFPTGDRPPAPQHVWDELMRRKALQAAVFSSRELAPDTLMLLRHYPWPLFVWQDSSLGGGTLSPTLLANDSLARVSLATPSVRILELFPPPRTR